MNEREWGCWGKGKKGLRKRGVVGGNEEKKIEDGLRKMLRINDGSVVCWLILSLWAGIEIIMHAMWRWGDGDGGMGSFLNEGKNGKEWDGGVDDDDESRSNPTPKTILPLGVQPQP